ncbi:MAG: glycosyltransferase family 4 protein [archaeon]
MKILFASTYIPPIAGGAEKVVWEIARRMAEYKNVEVDIATIGDKKFEKRENVNIHYFPKKPLLTLYYSTIGKKTVDDLFNKKSYDIIHVHILLPWLYLFRNKPGVKILTCHGDEVYNLRWYEKYYTKVALKSATAITSPSHWLLEEAQKSFERSVKYIANGVDTGEFVPSSNKTENYIFFYGRYIERKGFFELVNVAKSLPNYEFWFAGEGHLSYKLNLPNTKNLGYKNGTELIHLVQKARICVFPSHWENMPLVGLEALSCGKAIIATEKGFSEIIENGKSGIIIPPKDEESLKHAIVTLMEDDKLKHNLEKNARKKSAIYDWKEIAKQYFLLYENLLE